MIFRKQIVDLRNIQNNSADLPFIILQRDSVKLHIILIYCGLSRQKIRVQ